MRTIDEIRRARLLQLLGMPKYGRTVNELAACIRKSPAQVSQWKNKSRRSNGGESNIDSKSARDIEANLKLQLGWMDNDPMFDQRDTPAGMTDMAADIARWFDKLPDQGARDRAYVIISQMLVSGRWPTTSQPGHGPTAPPHPGP